MKNIILKQYKLIRNDGKIVEAEFYNDSDLDNVKILDIKNLKFKGKSVKDIKKSDIKEAVFKGEEKIYLQNKKSKIVAGLSKKHRNKIISTVFIKDSEGKYSYLKKEIISNIDTIFFYAIPILKHKELKKPILYNCQIIHRLALPLKIGGLVFFVMITVKERVDYKETILDEFTIYDLYSESQEHKKSFGSPSTVSASNNLVTTRSHYRMTKYSINDLIEFVKVSITKLQ
ncbi:MAG: hypothetical protein LUG16_05820 [Candidatus Gastranaerophilales bacterium]|nr:hypothetical protein [Candidatus Gastranaerophilales bacterium]